MKIWVLSDLHLRMSDLEWEIAPPDADVCVVAGDVTDPPLASIAWLQEKIATKMPVVFVAGNHEYYGHQYLDSLAEAQREAAQFHGVHFLERDAVEINGVRFLGATMWTDFDLYQTPERSMQIAARGMNDYRWISYSSTSARQFTPDVTREIHGESLSWLANELAKPFVGSTVVVTHTGPHELSIHESYQGDALNPAFITNLSETIEKHKPELWIHGHTHNSFDYIAPHSKTRIVCNPRGYVRRRNFGLDVENPKFERYKLVEVA